jgi:hypothetical protein
MNEVMGHHLMKTHIVADGKKRMTGSPEFHTTLRALRQSIRARHQDELAAAAFFRRWTIRWHMAVEYRRERHSIVPSSRSLYSSSIVTGSTREYRTNSA